MPDPSFVLFTLGPVQGFIKAARTVRDLWSGSYLLSYLTFRAMKAVADQSQQGAKAIVFPDVEQLPLWKWQPGTKADPSVLEPCIPNRFLAEVPDARDAVALAETAENACREAWQKIAEDVRAFLFAARGHPSFNADPERKNLWHQQIDTFFEVSTAVLPGSATDDQIRALLGTATADRWADRHQVAQKMLAAVKNRRHRSVYAPHLPADVPQKCSLLGTFEHMGPGNRQEANRFWESAADAWADRGSRVSDGEKLCAVSLVKRFAWAQHFSTKKVFDLNPQELRFDDTATVAAAVWLKTGAVLKPLAVRGKHKDWNGTWLHRSGPEAPTDAQGERVKGERPVPPDVWSAIAAKKRAEGQPPTYYAVFVFDGDKMGDRFSAALDAPTYRALSAALGQFALHRIKRIVEEEHGGQLIYAGGDDAICVLPTETALACVAEINAAFRDNWRAAFPGDEPATISGGLVVAHYKEDLRLVMEEAHKAEKRSKEAGRDALTLAVCRRSGEHSSATLRWDFVPTVGEWVAGFLAGASDRWAYKLRGDLDVLGDDAAMFRLELGRQLNRAEDGTRDRFPAAAVRAEFDRHPGTITDFVTLLQSASFLARGRDA
jgi:CRISPR-associated protein Cmr2